MCLLQDAHPPEGRSAACMPRNLHKRQESHLRPLEITVRPGETTSMHDLWPFLQRPTQRRLCESEGVIGGSSNATLCRGGARARRSRPQNPNGRNIRQFHQARVEDEYAFLFLDGVSCGYGVPGRKRVQMLVAYGVRRDGRRHVLAFLRSQGESQAEREGLLEDLYRRGCKASTWI